MDMTIGEIAAHARLATSAIRYYEKAGLLAAASRANGRRVYSAEILDQLMIIGFAKNTGFTLTEIKLLLRGFPESTPASARWKKLAKAKIAEMESIIAKAQAMKKMLESIMGCRCRKLEQCAEGFARHPEMWRPADKADRRSRKLAVG
jgi:MerR family redox-sensitive transcriptional activator SoxR